MKIMRYIISLAILLSIAAAGSAQNIFTLKYGATFPLGEMRSDYIQQISFRNWGLEGRYFMTDNIAIGGSFDWHVFNEDVPAEQYRDETVTVYGKQYRYVNAFPFLFTSHYYIKGDPFALSPYFGLGVGTAKIDQRTEMGVYVVKNNNWHFGLAPEIGLHVPLSVNFGMDFKVRYFYALKTKNAIAYSWLGVGIGLSFF